METLRDIVIIIAGILIIITLLGMYIGGFIMYRRVKRMIADIKARFRKMSLIFTFIRIIRSVVKRKSHAKSRERVKTQ